MALASDLLVSAAVAAEDGPPLQLDLVLKRTVRGDTSYRISQVDMTGTVKNTSGVPVGVIRPGSSGLNLPPYGGECA